MLHLSPGEVKKSCRENANSNVKEEYYLCLFVGVPVCLYLNEEIVRERREEPYEWM